MSIDFHEVQQIISETGGIPPEKIHLQTRINYDLGIDGDDAEELLIHLGERFDIALVEDFPFHTYFGDEGISPWDVFLRQSIRFSKNDSDAFYPEAAHSSEFTEYYEWGGR